MTAKEAKDKAKSVKHTKEMERLKISIQIAAGRGEYSYGHYGAIEDHSRKRLQAEGYNVEIVGILKDEFMTKISWA